MDTARQFQQERNKMSKVEDMMSPKMVVDSTITSNLDQAVMKALGYVHFIEGYGDWMFAAKDDGNGQPDMGTIFKFQEWAYEPESALKLLKQTVTRVRHEVDRFHLEKDNGLFTFNVHDNGEWVGKFNGPDSSAYARTQSWPECVTRVCLILLIELNRAKEE